MAPKKKRAPAPTPAPAADQSPMAAKKKRAPSPAPAPAAAQSSSSDDDASPDAEQYVRAERTERDDDESDSHSGSESDPNPPIKTLTPEKPSESEDSFEEDEQEEQEEVEKLKSPTKEPESQSDKKKQKVSTPDQPPSKTSSIIQRIWSLEDEITLLRALSEYQDKNNGKLPPRKDYDSFISGISGSIGFPVTVKQLFNKIRQMRFTYNQKKKKGSNIKFSHPHEKAVFDLCTKLYQDGSNASNKGSSQETNCDVETRSGAKRKKGITEPGSPMAADGGTATIGDGVANVGTANGGVVNGAVENGGDAVRSYFYLEGLIKEKCPRWLSRVEDVVAQIGESRARDLEAKTKMLRINAIKLHAREEKLMAELFDILADEMVDD